MMLVIRTTVRDPREQAASAWLHRSCPTASKGITHFLFSRNE